MEQKITKVSLLASISIFSLSFFANAQQVESPENTEAVEALTTIAEETIENEEKKIEAADSTIESVTPYKMFVTDKLFIFVHSGSSNRYRIIGRIGSSEEIKVVAKDKETGWLQVNYDKIKTGWVDSKMLTSTAGVKAKLSTANQQIQQLEKELKLANKQPDIDVDALNNELASLQSKNQQLTSQITTLITERQELEASIVQVNETQKILNKLYDVGVILIGIFIGWLLSRRKRKEISFNHL